MIAVAEFWPQVGLWVAFVFLSGLFLTRGKRR